MMKTFTIDNKYVIAFGSQDAALKFQLPLSHLIKEKYGDGPYSKIIVTQIISFCLDYYADRFEKICQTETSYTFYKMVFWFNEWRQTYTFF